jgi:hypothetical protein
VPTGTLATETGLDRKTIHRTKSGVTVPHPTHRARLIEAADRWAREHVLPPSGNGKDTDL